MVNPFQKERQIKIQTLKELIRDNQPVSHRKIVALIGVYGVTEKTANGYLKTLTDAEFIKYDAEKETYSLKEKKVTVKEAMQRATIYERDMKSELPKGQPSEVQK